MVGAMAVEAMAVEALVEAMAVALAEAVEAMAVEAMAEAMAEVMAVALVGTMEEGMGRSEGGCPSSPQTACCVQNRRNLGSQYYQSTISR